MCTGWMVISPFLSNASSSLLLHTLSFGDGWNNNKSTDTPFQKTLHPSHHCPSCHLYGGSLSCWMAYSWHSNSYGHNSCSSLHIWIDSHSCCCPPIYHKHSQSIYCSVHNQSVLLSIMPSISQISHARYASSLGLA